MLERDLHRAERSYVWPDNYYMETDASKRRACLEEALQSDPSPENQLRLQLWKARYENKKGKVDGTDAFIKGWLDMVYAVDHQTGFFGARTCKKMIPEIIRSLQLDSLAEHPDMQDIWYREYLHFCCFYIQISATDKAYSTTIFGIAKLSDDSLIRKLAQDLCSKTITYPRQLGIYDKQLLLRQAARDAYGLYYPDHVDLYEECMKEAESGTQE